MIAGSKLPGHIRSIICFDLFACALFALPWLSRQVIDLANQLNMKLGLGGNALILPEAGFFFVNFAGILGVVLNILLLKSKALQVHWINIYARIAVAIILAYYIGAHALPVIFGIFILTEIMGGFVTYLWLRKANQYAG